MRETENIREIKEEGEMEETIKNWPTGTIATDNQTNRKHTLIKEVQSIRDNKAAYRIIGLSWLDSFDAHWIYLEDN